MLYVEIEAFKASVSIPDTATDADVAMALAAASRAVEKATHRRTFDKDDSPVTRKYTARSSARISVDDIAQVNSVSVDGTAVTDYLAEPLNANNDGRPYTWLSSDSCVFTSSKRGAVQVTGLFGWPEIPDEVPQAVTILGSKLLKRSREAPFAIVNAGGIEGAAMRLAKTDPDVHVLIAPLTRHLVGWG